MERSRVSLMIAAALATAIVASVALLQYGAVWWLVVGFLALEAGIVGYGFWPKVSDRWPWLAKKKTIVVPDVEPLSVESSIDVPDDVYAFPDTLQSIVEPQGERHGYSNTYMIYLRVTNPGHADEWVGHVESAVGFSPSPAAGWPLKWRGGNGASIRMPTGVPVVAHLCEWDPMGAGVPPEPPPWRPGRMFVHTSTGTETLFVDREGMGGTQDLAAHRVSLVVRLVSDATSNVARYRVTIGARSLSDLSPEIDIVRLDGVGDGP